MPTIDEIRARLAEKREKEEATKQAQRAASEERDRRVSEASVAWPTVQDDIHSIVQQLDKELQESGIRVAVTNDVPHRDQSIGRFTISVTGDVKASLQFIVDELGIARSTMKVPHLQTSGASFSVATFDAAKFKDILLDLIDKALK